MQKRNHITFAGIFVLVLIFVLGWLGLNWINFSMVSMLAIVCITIFYSLLPDIDHKNSTITWWFFGIGVLGLVAGIVQLALNLSILSPMKILIYSTLLLTATFVSVNIFEHRGFTHSIPAGIIAVFPLYFLFFNFAYCLVAYVAWHSHLIGDGYLLKFK